MFLDVQALLIWLDQKSHGSFFYGDDHVKVVSISHLIQNLHQDLSDREVVSVMWIDLPQVVEGQFSDGSVPRAVGIKQFEDSKVVILILEMMVVHTNYQAAGVIPEQVYMSPHFMSSRNLQSKHHHSMCSTPDDV